MASLANQTISSSYDGLLKTSSDNAVPVSGVQALEDGAGNALALSVGRSGNGVTITGDLNATIATAAQPNITSVGTLTGLTTSGDIDVEVTGSNAFLTVNRTDASTAGALNIRSNNGNNQIESLGVKDLVISTDGLERMRIDSSGNVGIGTSSPAAGSLLDVNGDIKLAAGAKIKFNDDRYFSPENNVDGAEISANGIFKVKTGATPEERMRITSGGNLFVNTDVTPDASNGGFGVFASGGSTYIYNSTEQSTSWFHLQFINPNGIVGSISTNGSATAFNTSSDYRLKENVVEMTGALDRVDALNPSRFNFIADPDKTVDGFLAHEVAEVIPEAVTGEKDAVDEEGNPIYQGIDQSKITPLLTAAIKELKALVEAQQAEIETLKSQLNA